MSACVEGCNCEKCRWVRATLRAGFMPIVDPPERRALCERRAPNVSTHGPHMRPCLATCVIYADSTASRTIHAIGCPTQAMWRSGTDRRQSKEGRT